MPRSETRRPAIEARRRGNAGGHFVFSLSRVIGIDGVGEKNDGANANQKRNKERHEMFPILGGGKFRLVSVSKPFPWAAKTVSSSSAGALVPRYLFGRYAASLTSIAQFVACAISSHVFSRAAAVHA